MSKAEKRALEAYPKDIEKYIDVRGVRSVVDNNSWQRTIFLKGYHQAEKDLELTWEDIKDILNIYKEVIDMNSCEDIYRKVLKRFRDYKEKRK